MGALFQFIAEVLYWVAMVVIAIVTWIVVNFFRAVIQAIFPHPEFFDRRLF